MKWNGNEPERKRSVSPEQEPAWENYQARAARREAEAVAGPLVRRHTSALMGEQLQTRCTLTWEWDERDPHAIALGVWTDSPMAATTYTFGRELLHEGLTHNTGEGRVRISCFTGDARYTMVELEGTRVVLASERIEEFLNATYDKCTPDSASQRATRELEHYLFA